MSGRCVTLCAVALAVSGCGTLIDLLAPNETVVRLVNNGGFPVEVVVYYGSNQDAPRDVLTSVGTRIEFTIAAGETATFQRDCDDLQAVVVEQAELRVVGAIGPEASSAVQRDGSEFGCGDTITFTFDHSDLIVDFDVSTSIQSN